MATAEYLKQYARSKIGTYRERLRAIESLVMADSHRAQYIKGRMDELATLIGVIRQKSVAVSA